MMLSDWDYRFLEIAWVISCWSKDPSTKVGCVIVDKERRIIGTGYNGQARGLNDSAIGLATREERLRRTIHAEENAILFSVRDLTGCTAYITHMPCARCCAKLLQKGISRIVVPVQSEEFLARWKDDVECSKSMCEEAGVQLLIDEEIKCR